MSVAVLFIKCSQLSIFSSYFHSIVERPERTGRQSTKKTLLGRKWGPRYYSCLLHSHTPPPPPRTSRTASLAFSAACVKREVVNSLLYSPSTQSLVIKITGERKGQTFLFNSYDKLKKHTETIPGGYSQKNWVGVCGPLPKTLILFMTKICDIPYPIYDLTKNSNPY